MNEWISGIVFLVFATLFIGILFPDKLGFWIGIVAFGLLGGLLEKIFRNK
jgi:hypothetical protein